jgi:hypothetical protein
MPIEPLQTYGVVTAIEKAGRRSWLCRCDCGNAVEISAIALRRGGPLRCRCDQPEEVAGQRAGAYAALDNARQNCGNPRRPAYADYGGWGIVDPCLLHQFGRYFFM